MLVKSISIDCIECEHHEWFDCPNVSEYPKIIETEINFYNAN